MPARPCFLRSPKDIFLCTSYSWHVYWKNEGLRTSILENHGSCMHLMGMNIRHLVYTCAHTMNICAHIVFSLFNFCDQTCVYCNMFENLPGNIFWQHCCFLHCCSLRDSPGICAAGDSGLGCSILLQLFKRLFLPFFALEILSENGE